MLYELSSILNGKPRRVEANRALRYKNVMYFDCRSIPLSQPLLRSASETNVVHLESINIWSNQQAIKNVSNTESCNFEIKRLKKR